MKLKTKKFKWKYDLTKHKNLLNNFLISHIMLNKF
jgi:hypothetical protein